MEQNGALFKKLLVNASFLCCRICWYSNRLGVFMTIVCYGVSKSAPFVCKLRFGRGWAAVICGIRGLLMRCFVVD
jgi:hypothetical protein